MMKTTTRSDYKSRIARVTDAIMREPTSMRTVEEWAALANFSPFHFHRIYRAMQGECVSDTIRRARLTRAALQLSTTDRRVIDIALEAGYESAQSFARAFRSFVAASPSEFRAGHRTVADFIAPIVIERKDEIMNVDIIEREPTRAHVLQHRGPIASIPESWANLWRWHVQAGLGGRSLYPIGVCFGDPETSGGFRYYAGLVFPDGVAASGEVETLDVPGGRYASYRHIGPYAGIGGAFQKLYGQWLPSSGYEPDDRPSLEVYRNTPYDTPPEALITDLLVPVK
ncbi:MAG: AraC family transcriptional regulator [Methylocystaceae bacterium]|nr:MAG: AraC family transcriptional regulator [Methylocystaceae bacterium]